MKVRTRLLGLLAVVTLMAGLLPLTAFATQQQEYPTKRCYEQVNEVQYKRPILRDEVRYEKFVKGKIEKKVWKIKPIWAEWKVVDTFDWVDWPGAGPLDWGEVPNPMSGSHNSIFDQTGNDIGDTRKRSTYFEYRTVDTRQVPTGEYEYSDWMPEGEQPDGEGWQFHMDRTVDGDEIPCYEITASAECGIVFGSVLDNNTPYGAGVWGVVGTDLPALVPGTQTPEQVGAFSLPHEFDEDFNDGNPVTVTVFVVGPEGDYYKDGELRSSIFTAQVTVDTNCEDDLIDNPGFSFGHETLVCDPETGEFDAQADGFITLNEGANYSWDGESQTGLSAGNFGPFIATASEGFTFAEGKTFSTGAINILAIPDHEECDRLTTPVEPEVTESEACEVNDSFTIPDTEGVVYFVNDEEAEAGTVFNTPGSYTITAQAADGYELTDPEWSMGITLEAGEPCPSTTPSTLPFTGADTGTMALAALVLTGLGGLILALSRKPEEDGIN